MHDANRYTVASITPNGDRMTTTSLDTAERLKHLLSDVLNLGAQADTLTLASPLLGALPQLDSMAIAALIAGIEDHFGIEFEDDDLTEATFGTLGSLTAIVSARRID